MTKQITISREKFLNIAPWLESFSDDRMTTNGNVLLDLSELQNQVPSSVFEEILKHANEKPAQLAAPETTYRGAHRVANPSATPQPTPPKSVEPSPPHAEEKVVDLDQLQRDSTNASIQQHEADTLIEQYFKNGLDRSNKDVIFKWFIDNKAKPTVEKVQQMIRELGHAGSNTLTWTPLRPAPIAAPVSPAPPPPAPEILEPLPSGEPRLLSTATNEELHRASTAQLKEFIARNKTPQPEAGLASWQLPIDADSKTVRHANPRAVRDLVHRKGLLGIVN